ncbi:MAG: aminodeoxychorismate/anthranilate synthase component II [Pelagibacteraceae bacterium TMED237]|nr:aminodeoxychorismate/anthranilate synthase component II [Candidatus Neomarinimicrobiota bacterium]OUW96312.1 MAG: aminodeoxychorismate/anthranilate synthase component II [Pelagibacteraceae bacterium TMED237]|tara:strand:+ start:5561 stop:6121 length:561 start_codon:yes stop_codon:yes gene_type:complete
MIVIIDNYDSFTYNLYQYVGVHSTKVRVFKNNEINIRNIVELSPNKIIISPGPGHPKNSNVSLECIQYFSGKIPILGVCLGHQAIGFQYGSSIINSNIVCHGKTSMISHNGDRLFRNVPSPFEATRYHSLIIDKNNLSRDLEVIADYKNIIMAIKHKKYPVYGVQFHPESVKTENGMKIIENFIFL